MMIKKLLFVVLLLTITSIAEAGNWYVRPSGGGGGGTSWTNAWNGMGGIQWASVSCGDTIWIAGGTYNTSLYPNKVCTSGAKLYIKRARSDATECTNAVGWSASYDSTVTQIQSGIIFQDNNVSYVVISGRTTSAGIPETYGWLIDYYGATTGSGIDFLNGTYAYTYNTIEYIDLAGPGSRSRITYTGADSRGIDLSPIGSGQPSASYNTFSHCAVHGWATACYNANAHYTIWEYLDVYDIEPINSASYHPNGIYINGSWSNYGTVKYSKWHSGNYGGVGEGLFFAYYGTFYGWKIYGNRFYDLPNVGQKGIHIRDDSTVYDLLVYNNTWDNVLQAYYRGATSICMTGNEARNNLVYSSTGWNPCGTASNNINQSSPDPFVDRTNHNYHLSAATTAGYALSSPYNTDVDGNTRGADGIWDIGAYEYGGIVTYTVGGSIAGLTGTVELTVSYTNGPEYLSKSANGSYTFLHAFSSGDSYAVTVNTQPVGQTCTVTNGSGTVSGNVTNVNVYCTTNQVSTGTHHLNNGYHKGGKLR